MTLRQVCYDCLLNSYSSILFIKINLDSQYYVTDGVMGRAGYQTLTVWVTLPLLL